MLMAHFTPSQQCFVELISGDWKQFEHSEVIVKTRQDAYAQSKALYECACLTVWMRLLVQSALSAQLE